MANNISYEIEKYLYSNLGMNETSYAIIGIGYCIIYFID